MIGLVFYVDSDYFIEKGFGQKEQYKPQRVF